VIAEAGLDPTSIYQAIERFAQKREIRLEHQRQALSEL